MREVKEIGCGWVLVVRRMSERSTIDNGSFNDYDWRL